MDGTDDRPLGRIDEILPAVYDELRQLAVRSMRHERADHTLQPSALVNEVYLRLGRSEQAQWESRAHFFAAAAEAIRRILIEHARRHNAQKRSGGWQRMSLEDADGARMTEEVDLLELDAALLQLEQFDRRLERVVQLRFFGGLTMNEVAEVTGLSKRTVENDWAVARAWLRRELATDDVEAE